MPGDNLGGCLFFVVGETFDLDVVAGDYFIVISTKLTEICCGLLPGQKVHTSIFELLKASPRLIKPDLVIVVCSFFPRCNVTPK